MREVKYDYNGVKSVTKLNNRQQEMLKWWQEFIAKNNDRLLAVDNTYAVMKTEKNGEIQFSNLLTSNLLGSSQSVVERILFELTDVYKKIFASSEVKAYSVFKAKINRFKNRFYFQKQLQNIISEIENMTLTKKEPIKNIVYRVGKVARNVTYFVYEPINSVARIALGDEEKLIELVRNYHALRFQTKFFREEYLSAEINDLEAERIIFDLYKGQEDMLLTTLRCDIEEKLIEVLQKYSVSHPGQIEVSFNIKSGESK